MIETDTPCCRAAELGQSCTCQMRLTNGDGTRIDWKAAWYALDADNLALLARAEKAEAERDAAWNEAIETAAGCVCHLTQSEDRDAIMALRKGVTP